MSSPSFLLASWGFSCCLRSHQLLYIPLSLTSSASFHTLLASPPLLNASPGFPSPESLFIPLHRALFLDSSFVPSCHVCIRQCCLKQPFYSYPSLLQIPAPRHFLCPYFLSCFGRARRAALLRMYRDTGYQQPYIANTQRSPRLSLQEVGQPLGNLWGVLRSTQRQQKHKLHHLLLVRSHGPAQARHFPLTFRAKQENQSNGKLDTAVGRQSKGLC